MLKNLIFGAVTAALLISCTALGLTAQQNPKVLMKTSLGDITLELYPDKAPLTVKNFLSYVDEHFYDGTIFHRVIKGFMIQGGGYTIDFSEKLTKPSIENEAWNGLKNARGTIAMARTTEPHSATCQFFINHADNSFLDHRNKTAEGYGYCVFGKVVDGLDVVDEIANVKTMTKYSHQDVPRETIKIKSALLIADKK
jgi:peptidyl-prolyl cis-trans isomerase B (cyclophilin B)